MFKVLVTGVALGVFLGVRYYVPIKQTADRANEWWDENVSDWIAEAKFALREAAEEAREIWYEALAEAKQRA